jgi:hypothetical protein
MSAAIRQMRGPGSNPIGRSQDGSIGRDAICFNGAGLLAWTFVPRLQRRDFCSDAPACCCWD